MSDFGIDLEDQPVYRDVPEFDDLSDQVSNGLLEISNSLSSLEKNLELLEQRASKAEPTDKFQGNCVALVKRLTDKFKDVSVYAKEMNAIDSGILNRSQLFVKNKLNSSLKSSLDQFNDYQRRMTDIERQMNAANLRNIEEQERQSQQGSGSRSGSMSDGESQPQVVIEYEPVNAEEIEYQRNLVEEREREIERISEGVTEVNQIFQDMSTLVVSQGEMIDNIENNIYSTLHDTRMASRHLAKADRYHSNRQRLCFWLMLILGMVFVFVIFIVSA